jgi:hypothetical protein
VKRSILAVPVLVVLFAWAGPALAQDSSTFVVGLLGGIGGAFEGASDRGFDQRAVQAEVGMLTNDRTYVMLRGGRLTFDRDLEVGRLLDAELEYVTVAGEYRFRQPIYDFGIYLGLGGYRLSGFEPDRGDVKETALGLSLGLTGDFDMTRRLSFVGEFAVHYVFLDRADLYGVGLAGLAVHF